MSRQIPPLAIANLAARRVFGFDIDNSQPPETHACHPDARPWGQEDPGSAGDGRGQAFCSFTTVQADERGYQSPEHLPRAI
jgi:hypothetical protein